MKTPPITPELVAYLDELYPERCPDPGMAEREIWMYAGARRLVASLKTKLAVRNQIERRSNPSTITPDPET